MHPDTPSVIAKQRYRERLAEASALRPSRLARASSKQQVDSSGDLTRWLPFRLVWQSPRRRRVIGRAA